MKLKLSVAVLATAAFALAAAPAEAQSKKKGGKAAKVTVTKSAGPYWASQHNACASVGAGMWYPIAAVGAIGCSVFYAVPVMAEGFLWPQSSKA